VPQRSSTLAAARESADLAATEGTGVPALERDRSRFFSLTCPVKYCILVFMKVTMTARLKLLTTPEQFQALCQMHVAYRDALHAVSRYVYVHGERRNQQRLQCECYDDIRLWSGLPAHQAWNVLWQVGATCKSVWVEVRKNAEQRKAGWTRKFSKGLARAPHDVSPTRTSTDQRDSILTLSERVIRPSTGSGKHVALLARGARLWCDRSRKRYYLLISLGVEVTDPLLHLRQRASRGHEPAHSGGCGPTGSRHILLFWPQGAGQDQSLCAAEETVAEERHSRSGPEAGGDRCVRERVEPRAHPHAQSAHRGAAPTQSRRPGKPDSYPRAHQGPVRPSDNQEAATGHRARLHMGLCRLARLPGLAGAAGWFDGGESGRGLHRPGVPRMRVYLRAEPPPQGVALRVPELPVSAACRSGRCKKRRNACATHLARLDAYGRLVSTPRGPLPGYVGTGSHSGTPACAGTPHCSCVQM
jgi:hypothetical protein